MDSGNGCTTLQMYLILLNCTLKMVHFMLHFMTILQYLPSIDLPVPNFSENDMLPLLIKVMRQRGGYSKVDLSKCPSMAHQVAG